MNTRHTIAVLAALGALIAQSGCGTLLTPAAPQDTNKFTVGNTERFVALDPATEAAVACTGLQERTLADGRLEVVANVKNRGASPVRVSIACAFADLQGLPVGGDPAWTVLRIAGGATEVVRFTAPGVPARKYAIRVRDAR
jgi:hypothetical protein